MVGSLCASHSSIYYSKVPQCVFFFIFAHRLCTLYHRLQAELEEAREEARIKAQEEIVVRIQEAKVIIVT